MEINLFFAGVDSKYGYQSDLLNRIDEQIHFHKCVMTVKSHDALDVYDDKYICINYDVCEHNRYGEFYDFNDMEALSRDLLEKMNPYESIAMKMLVRNMEVDVYTYEEAKRLYLRHLRFWNHVFETYRINFVVFNCTPHHTHDYIIYALAKIKNIGMSVNVVTNIQNWWFTGSDIFGVGEAVSKEYYEHCHDKEEVKLPPQIESYYQALIYQEQGADKNVVYGGKTAKQMKQVQNATFWSFAGTKNTLIRHGKIWKSNLKRSLAERSVQPLKKAWYAAKEDRYFLRRIRLKIKSMRKLSYYEKMAELPNYQEPYIVYYLHYQPEGTTLPQAGVFVEQEVILQILSKSLEGTGIQLYVKEHFVQLYRSKSFYDDIAAIKNVKLIKSSIDSKTLMIHSMATSACNGTIILESIINGKPSLVFSAGGFSDGPGIIPVNSVEECKQAIQKIQNGQAAFTQQQVRRYFKAFANQGVYAETFWSRCEEDGDKLERSKTSNIARITRAIEEYKRRNESV